MRVAVVVNARSGSALRPAPADRRAQLENAFEAVGVGIRILTFNPASLERDIQRAVDDGFDAIVAAGGDGTVSSVAGLLTDGGVAFGIVPLGTLNHFARDAGIPPQLDAAVRLIAEARTRAVDVAEVNGRCFVNNSSIGLYPHLVTRRDRRQERLGYGKWPAMLAALPSLFRRYPVVSVVLETEERRVPRTAPFVFVGNNRYAIDGLMIGTRQRLDEGLLSVYFANRTGRFGLFRLALRALFGRLRQAADFDSLTAPAMQIHTRKKTLQVSTDGEVLRLVPPLAYRIRPGALRLIVPAERA